MRKYQQKQILESIKTLYEATAEIKRFLSRKDSNSVMQILADCQEMAIQIGNYIEQLEGDGTQTVSRLEEYCQLLYQANVEINHTGPDIKIDKPLQKQLIKIENSVRDELKPNKIEIAFISYKASMSDSIESIYLAAKADPFCDAFFIPIPYYNVTPDNSLGMMHYEGADCYGDDIEITDWRKYNIEVRHPDVVFTFNPYDEGNLVTRVHPDFFCRKLREHTDLLVYVPYFVIADDVLDHFCATAGCIYAHKVIVQSEKVRDTYIRVFNKTFGDRFGKVKNKFVALGSPKYDKVINTKREDCKLPVEWRDLIGGRKVILYSSTVGAILRGNEQYLKKIQHILDTFRGRDDVVLWWRPHPLNEVAYQAMRPQLLDKYNQIIVDYNRERWGIYDDTFDVHRAIAWMDAYYGDGGSVPVMCLVTGKPVMIGNVDVLSNDINFPPTYLYAAEDDIWISVKYINALFKMRRADWTLEFVDKFPSEKDYVPGYHDTLYSKPTYGSGVLYFPPFLAKDIATYSLCDNTFEKIPYKRDVNGAEIDRAFSGAVVYNDHTFFTPYQYPAIIRMSSITKEISYYSDWVEPLKELIGNVHDAYFLSPLTIGDTIFLAACGTNAVVEFNMETCKSIVYEVGKKGYRYGGICFDGENYWLSPRHNSPVLKWNPKAGIIKEFAELFLDDSCTQYCFLYIIYNNGYVWLLPHTAQYAVKINTLTDVISIADEFEINRQEQDGTRPLGPKYMIAQSIEDSIYSYYNQSMTLVEYNCATGERREGFIQYSPGAQTHLRKMLISQQFLAAPETLNTVYGCCYSESNYVPLVSFIDYIIGENNTSQELAIRNRRKEIIYSSNTNVDGTAGQAIYDYVKDAVFKQ